MSLRSELLDMAVAERERALAALAKKPDLAFVAGFEWDRIVDKLAQGKPYRLTRDELPESHPLHRHRQRGCCEVLVLTGDELQGGIAVERVEL